MSTQGYVRFPTIHQDRIIFVAEDDLWYVSSEGGRAERLTAGLGEVSYPHFSPDGELLAFVGREEGPSEVYVMPSLGGTAQRLTFHSASCRIVGWDLSGKAILYASNAGQALSGHTVIYAISPQGGQSRQIPVGIANAISYGPEGGVIIGRTMREPAYWKRYRGGTAGHLWCDPTGNGTFQRLLHLNGNIASPCWVGERIYFLSDHDGVGNIYSCTPSGDDIRRHTNHNDFYARNLSSDGQRLVYHAGTDLYLFDPSTATARQLDIVLPSTRTQRNRKFVPAGNYLDTYALHPKGYAVALTTRGKAFTMGNWDGPVLQHGEPDGVRYRFLAWLNDGKRIVAINDETDHESLIVFNPDESTEPKSFADIEFGRATDLTVSPAEDAVAIANHRNELLLIDLEVGSSRTIDRSDFGQIRGIDWSPDGRWLAYGYRSTEQKTAIKLCNLESGETYFATEPTLHDTAPAFDPEGKYLYFLGYRIFNPVYDQLHFDLSFPRGVKPYAITLRRDVRSPFIAEPKIPEEKEQEEAKEDKQEEKEQEGSSETEEENKKEKSKKPTPIVIDLEGITN